MSGCSVIGPQGATGSTGATGATGPQGPAGNTDAYVLSWRNVNLAAIGNYTSEQTVPTGKLWVPNQLIMKWVSGSASDGTGLSVYLGTTSGSSDILVTTGFAGAVITSLTAGEASRISSISGSGIPVAAALSNVFFRVHVALVAGNTVVDVFCLGTLIS